jgi:hypothetical protein
VWVLRVASDGAIVLPLVPISPDDCLLERCSRMEDHMKPILVLELAKLTADEVAALRRDGFEVPPNIAGYKFYGVNGRPYNGRVEVTVREGRIQ